MKRKSRLRTIIASLLPNSVRRFVGRWGVWFYERAIRPILGLIFDLRGGKFRVDGCVIEVPKHLTTRTYRGCFMVGDYEAGERALVRNLLRPKDSVLEIGACIGAVSCVTNRLLADKTRHVVVEGNPKLIPTIKRNRDNNQCGFTVLNMAVSQEKEVTFYLCEEFIVGGTAQRESPHPVKVDGITLQELDLQYGPFNVLIMDIEGGEIEAIPNAPGFLERCRLVIWETHDWAFGSDATQRCRDALTEAGLKHVKTEEDTEAWARID
jgi:FkbM family methyltransferase